MVVFELKPGRKYSRSDVSEFLGLGDKAKGGIWVSGIREHRGEFFIFTIVGAPGTIAADSGNRWEGPLLRWFHKKNSRPDWPSVKRLLDIGRAHVFWRSSTQDLFEYAGYAQKVESSGVAPVGIVWSFDNALNSGLLQSLGMAARDSVPRHDFLVGNRVRHPDMGLGRVLAISGLGDDASATVFFAGLEAREEIALSEVEKLAGFGPS